MFWNVIDNGKIKQVEVNNMTDALMNMPEDLSGTVVDNFVIAWNKINSSKYNKIICSVSGGSDSDIMLDIVTKCDISHKVSYVFFDTGFEFDATKEHLKELECKYNISIIRKKAIKSIPLSCKEYGIPFLNKRASEYIYRLQLHDFAWEDAPYEELVKKYCKPVAEEEALKKGSTSDGCAYVDGQYYRGCISALAWFCNANPVGSRCNINNNPGLREFLIAYPPEFSISNKCCEWAKKKVSHSLIEDGDYDLCLVGIRKAEGGARATIKNCFSEGEKTDTYRPIFWYSDADKRIYEKTFGVTHSDCYKKYGLRRTGCVGCPFAPNLSAELEAVRINEPGLYRAVMNTFWVSYDYRMKYDNFRIKNGFRAKCPFREA